MKTALYRCPKCGKQNRQPLPGNGEWVCNVCNSDSVLKRVRGTTVDSVKRVRFNRHNASFAVDTEVSELDIRATIPAVFANSRGSRETYTVHRGCLIVRHTVKYDGNPERRTVAYLFGRWPKETKSDLFIAGPDFPEHLTSIAHAKRHLDAILDSGKCWQDLQGAKP